MTCIKKITQNIVNACKSTRGLKPRAYWANRSDCNFTFSGNVITAVDTFILGIIDGTKFSLNAGSDEVVFDDNGSVFSHKFTGVINVQDGSADAIDDIVVFVQTNGGQWLCYGAEQGLWKASQSQMSNDNRATVVIEMNSIEGREEEYSEYIVNADLSLIATTETYEVMSLFYNKTNVISFNSTSIPTTNIKVYDPDGILIVNAGNISGFIAQKTGDYRFLIHKTSIESFKLIDVDVFQSIQYLGSSLSLENCNFSDIYAPNSSLTLTAGPKPTNYNSIVFDVNLGASEDELSLSIIERILYDKVCEGKIVTIDLSGSNPAINIWTSKAIEYKNTLVAGGSTITYNAS